MAKPVAKKVLHHDDSPCNARLDQNRYCVFCKVVPDTQSTQLCSYCPSCDVPLNDLKCPTCGGRFASPFQDRVPDYNPEDVKKTIGSYLAIQIDGDPYIAEVIEETPLILKVEEEGPFSRLKSDDYILMYYESARLQDPQQEALVLREAIGRANAFRSGLRSLGVTDDKLHEIGPG